MEDPRNALTSSANQHPGGTQSNHETGRARKSPSCPAVKVTGRQTLKGAVRLSCLLVLLAVVASVNTSSRQVLQVAALRQGRLSRDPRSVARRETSEREGFSVVREFNVTPYVTFINDVRTWSPEKVLSEATELMKLLRVAPPKPTFIPYLIGKILLHTIGLEDSFILTHQEPISRVIQIAKQNLIALPITIGNETVLDGNGVQIAVLRIGESSRDPVVALCSLRNKKTEFEEIPRSLLQATTLPDDKCYFTLTLSDSELRNTSVAVIAYPANWVIRPMPSNGYEIYYSRVVDVAIGPCAIKPSSGDSLLSLYFKPTVAVETKKGCAAWSRTRGDWTTDGCWVGPQADVCRCNLTAHREEDEVGGQYIVYEYSDVFFNETRYQYIRKDENIWLQPEYYFSEASSLVHNLSLVPANELTIDRLHNIFLRVLRFNFYRFTYSKMNFNFDYIRRLYIDARTMFNRREFPNYHINAGLAFILFVTENSDQLKDGFHLTDFPKSVKFFSNTSTDANISFHETNFGYALRASRSVARQNNRVSYMVFPINYFLFPPNKDFGRFQVHNFRVVDVTLAPRVGVDSEEDQFLDIWYRPSVFDVHAKNLRLGCAYWKDHDAVWTDKSCVVHVNATPGGCRCNLSANFVDNRKGGQYAVFEYSDIRLDYERMDSILEATEPDDSQQDVSLLVIRTFLQNLTAVGFIDDNNILYLRNAALFALTVAEGALKRDASLTNTLIEYMHLIVQRWAHDTPLVSAARSRHREIGISASSPVAVEAHEVLSNKVVLTKTSMLQQVTLVLLRLGDPESPIGEKTTAGKISFLTPDSHLSAEPQFSYFFPVVSGDVVSFAGIKYPRNKMLLALSRSLPAVFSYHCLEMAIISEDNVNTLPTSSRLVTLVYIPEGPEHAAASTACAVWTGSHWSSKTCWPHVGNEHACTCNLSAHALPVGKFLPLLVYKKVEADNFSPKGSLNALDVFYVISSAVSLVGLLLIVLTAIVFPQWRADVGHKIMLHLSLALFLYQTLRVFRETHHVYTALNRDDAKAFIAFAVATHYSRLAHYVWMLTMSVLQLRRLLTVVGATDIPHLLLKVCALAWGLPLLPLIALLSWDRVEHFALPGQLSHLVLYLVPGIVVTGVNFVVFLVIAARVFTCFGWGKTDDLGRHGISNAKLTRRRMATLALLFFLFGTTTVFETANDFWGHSWTLEVLFKLLDPVRGAVVFLYFVVLDKKTLDMWRQKIRVLTERGTTQDFEMK